MKFNYKVFYCDASMESDILNKAALTVIVIPKSTFGVPNQIKWNLED